MKIQSKSPLTVLEWILIVIMLLATVFFRLQYFSFVQVTSDSLSPFVGAIRAIDQWHWLPANPESDQWLWVLALPLVMVADSLSDLFWLKCLSTSIVVPIGMWVVGQMVSKLRWFWMLGTGALLMVDLGLIDTMLSSFRGYWAPECLALALVGWVHWQKGHLWGALWGTGWLTIAMGQHPLVLGCTPILLGWWIHMKVRGQAWYLAVGIFTVLSIPRLIWLWSLSQCDAGGLQCFSEIAISSSENQPMSDMLWRVLHDRLWVEMGLAGPIMILGCSFSSNQYLRRGILLGLLGITILGLSVSTLRPYHYRVLIVPLFIWAAHGWSQRGKVGVGVFSIWIALSFWTRLHPVEWYSTVSTYDAIADFLCKQSNPVWIEGYGSDLKVMPQGVGVSMKLQRCQVPMSRAPSSSIWVLSSPDDLGSSLLAGESIEFEDVFLHSIETSQFQRSESGLWWSGYDVAILSHPETQVHLDW